MLTESIDEETCQSPFARIHLILPHHHTLCIISIDSKSTCDLGGFSGELECQLHPFKLFEFEDGLQHVYKCFSVTICAQVGIYLCRFY